MFGHRYFGKRYFAVRYFGPAISGAASPTVPVMTEMQISFRTRHRKG